MRLYHFTDSPNITKFKHVKPQRGYSQATGNGVYFTSDYAKGVLKYGKRAKYCYVCEFIHPRQSVLNLGEFNAMYLKGKLIHSSSLVSINFKRAMNGEMEIPDPDIELELLSSKAYKWLKDKGYSAITGMHHWGYACPEFVILDTESIILKEKIKLN